MQNKKILWADDEIDLLQPHILFLQSKGYDIDTVTNGDDAVSKAESEVYDIILLDEMMSGKDGLAALQEIKTAQPYVPVIMITKSEEESLMEEAIGEKIDDYLTKPVNPSQILMACKKLLDKKNITTERRSRQYAQNLSDLSMALMNDPDAQQWIDLSLKIAGWDVELDSSSDSSFREVLYDQRKECNVQFGKFIERNYGNWVQGKGERPVLSTDLVKKYVIPELKAGKKTVLVVIDCMRMDQWMIFEPFFNEYFKINRNYYYSILPTATPFSRNAIFSGLFPLEIQRKHPDLWIDDSEDEGSLNKYEKKLLTENLRRNRVELPRDLKYIKLINNDETRVLEKQITNYLDTDLLAIVVNFVDVLAHSRSDMPILKEIAPDEAAYRSLTRSWFEHSAIFNVFKAIAQAGHTIILTTDHGSVRGLRGTKVIGDRETSTNLRYKFGRSLKADKKHAIFLKDPAEYKLPRSGMNTTYIIAKEDFYFVYPTNYHRYLNYYKDSFQHGGASMEEMILPVIRLESKQG